jgi:hypothetical protein
VTDSPVTDPKDVRVLIPRVRRALDGPHAVGSAAVSNTLSDEEVTNQIADSIASVIFYSGGLFGKTLEVTSRDEFYMAPNGWATSEELTEPEATVVVAQAALDYFFHTLQSFKTSESIVNEGEEWSWSISAQAVAERVKSLQRARDEAIALLEATLIEDDWVNTLAVRDAFTDALIEPWLLDGYGGQDIDPRFG